MSRRSPLASGSLVVGLVLTGCGSAGSDRSASTTSAAVTTGAAICPTHGQAEAALGVALNGPTSTPTRGGGIICEYTGGGGTAAVTIFSRQSAAVFAGQIAHAPGAPTMPSISGVGDGAFGADIGGRSIVNAYSNGSRTLVEAQAPGALPPVEALARVALANN